MPSPSGNVFKPTYPYWLAGRAHAPNASLEVLDKYDGTVATRVAMADAAAVDAAIAAAYAARTEVAAFTPDARRDVLEHCVRRFQERSEEFALALCIEAGKPIHDARGEVARLIDTFRIAAGEATRIDGEVLELQVSERARGLRGMTRRVPVGVCSFITPFNFPLNLVAHKVAPAIAAGCPFVLKPSERTPLGALLIAEILAETKLPPGAFSVLPCKVEDAGALTEDERIALLSFTGGLVGWSLRARAGRKKVVLELGGNAACVIDDDPGVPLAHLIERLAFGAYYQSGQSCISVQRIIVHEAMYDRVRDAFATAVRGLVCGDPKDETTFIGPVIDEASAKRLDAWMDEAVAGGATALVRGKAKGTMLPPALLENVPRDCALYRQEAFGPVGLLEKVASFDEALARVNDSDFGLQAGVFTARLDHAMRAWDRLEVGGVILGDLPRLPGDNRPQGGHQGPRPRPHDARPPMDDMLETRLLVIKQTPPA